MLTRHKSRPRPRFRSTPLPHPLGIPPNVLASPDSGPADLDALHAAVAATVALRKDLLQSAADLRAFATRLDASAFAKAGRDVDGVRRYARCLAAEALALLGLRVAPASVEPAIVLRSQAFGPSEARAALEDFAADRAELATKGGLLRATLAAAVEHLQREAASRPLSREELSLFADARAAARTLSRFTSGAPAPHPAEEAAPPRAPVG